MPPGIQTFLYADDTALVSTGNSIDETSDKLIAALEDAGKWFQDHKLCLNIQKTKHMVFSTSHRLKTTTDIKPVTVNGTTVEEVTQFKYLGILLDHHLSFKSHAAYLRRKIFAKLKVLGRVSQYVSQKLALYLYKSLVLPEFDYGDQIYDSMSATTAKQLQVLQNSCLRVCLKADKGTPVIDLHTEAGLPTLDVRRKVHVCNFVNKGLHDKLSKGVNNMFKYNRDNNNVGTRSSSNGSVQVPRSKLKLSDGNLAVRGGNYYNVLPLSLRNESDSVKFNTEIKAYYYGCTDRGVT